MKVAFILTTCANLGPFIVAKNIIDNIANGVDVIDIYYIRESDTDLLFKANSKKRIGLFTPISWESYDVIHSHGFLADLYVFLHKRKMPGRCITTLHQEIKPDYTMTHNRLTAFLLEKFWCYIIRHRYAVVTLTHSMLLYYERLIPGTNLTYIYNGVNYEKGHRVDDEQIKNLKSRYKLLGVTARLIKRKGIDQIVKALPFLPGFALMVIGEGEEKENLLLMAAELNVSERCLFVGYKPESINYLSWLDLYIMSSRSEGFGLCVIEAASQAIPVICSDLPVYRELFDEQEVVRFQLEDTASLISAIKRASENQKLLSERVFEKYNNVFTAGSMAQKYLKLYSDDIA